MSRYANPDLAAATLFHPLADPERRRLDPLGALTAGHDLRILLGIGEADAVRHARQADRTWEEIAAAAGISRQAAHAKWSVAAAALVDGAASMAGERRILGCAHALDARNCSEPGGACPDALDALRAWSDSPTG